MKYLRQISFALLVLLASLLAVANRASVTVSLDPIEPAAQELTFQAPLFLVIFIAMFCGILLGGFAVWLGQRKSRVIVDPAPAAPAVEGNAGRLTHL